MVCCSLFMVSSVYVYCLIKCGFYTDNAYKAGNLTLKIQIVQKIVSKV